MKQPLLIHIPKTGGTSLQNNGHIKIECFGHTFARDIPDISNYYSFAVVRDPAERMLSSFNFYKYLYQGERYIKDHIQQYKTIDDLINDWDNFECQEDIQLVHQWEFIYGNGDNKLVDRIVNYNDLNEFFQELTGKDVTLPRLRPSPVESKITDRLIDFCKKYYALDYLLLSL